MVTSETGDKLFFCSEDLLASPPSGWSQSVVAGALLNATGHHMSPTPKTTLPPARPAPAVVKRIRSPEANGRSMLDRDSDNGMVAAEEFPNSSIVWTVLLLAMPRFSQTASKIRILA